MILEAIMPLAAGREKIPSFGEKVVRQYLHGVDMDVL